MMGVGTGVAGAALKRVARAAGADAGVAAPAAPKRRPVSYPPVDVAYFDKPITPVPFPIAFGCAAITWKDSPRKALEDISGAGYRGVQLMANAIKEWPDPAALRAELAKRHLTLVTFSGGNPDNVDDANAEVAQLVTRAQYARDAGALRFQITSPSRERGVDAHKLKKLAAILNEVGRRTAKLEMPVAFHNHLDQMGQSPAELDAILAATDPKLVRLLLDVGHYRAAGGDPVAAIRKHARRLTMLHLKDVTAPVAPDKRGRFVPLGSGIVDFTAVFAALARVKYRGWVVAELDSAPEGMTPVEAATANRTFIEKTVGVVI